MNKEMLDALGITKEEIINKTASMIAEDIASGESVLCEGFEQEIKEIVTKTALAQVRKAADTHLVPQLEAAVTDTLIQPTNQWGEPKGDSMTLTEFLLKSAESHMAEMVNDKGETYEEVRRRGSSFKEFGTRLVYVVESMLHKNLKAVVEDPMKLGIESVRQAIEDTTKRAMSGLAENLKVVLQKTKKGS